MSNNIVTAYQTLEDRDNIDEIEMEGPFECTRPDAWLGFGYYFWDTNIDWAISWGRNSFERFNKEFVVGRCKIDISNKCFDLVGCVQHWNDLVEVLKVMRDSKKIKNENEELIPNIITFMKRNGIFDYNSIRASDMHSNTIKLFFRKYKNEYMEYMTINQRVQICVINKKNVILQPFSVIYPEKYVI